MKQNIANFPVTLSGKWRLPNDKSVSLLSENIKNWLLDEGSLTARLKKHCEDFKVEVIGEEQQACSANEACNFIKAGEPVLVREVILYCDNIPQVFARSLLPLRSLTGKEQALSNLGEQPLGQVLFNNPSLQRQRLELSAFTCDSSVGRLAEALVGNKIAAPQQVPEDMTKALWGRRSIFILDHKPLMVAEVFLPDAFAYQSNDTY